MNRDAFLRRVRELAADTANIFIVRHARRRMAERGHSDEDEVLALRRGMLEDGPFCNPKGHWQATVYRRYAGQEIRVVSVLEDGIVIITVI